MKDMGLLAARSLAYVQDGIDGLEIFGERTRHVPVLKWKPDAKQAGRDSQ
jgi:hypothetical protein